MTIIVVAEIMTHIAAIKMIIFSQTNSGFKGIIFM